MSTEDKTTSDSPQNNRNSGYEFAEHTKIYELPKDYLSVSQVGLYQKCGERYRRKYVADQPSPLSSNQSHGRLIHRAVETMLRYKMEHEQQTPPPEVGQDAISDNLQEATQDIEVWDPKVQNAEEFEETARELVTIYQEDRLPEALPRAVELKMETILRNSIPFVGWTDMVEASPMNTHPEPIKELGDIAQADSVRDLKATGRKYGAHRVENSLQLSLYAEILNVENVGFDLLVQKKKSEFVRQDFIRTPREKKHAVDVVEDVAKAISAGIFPRTDPEHWMCSKKWCPYFAECRGSAMSVHALPKVEEDL